MKTKLKTDSEFIVKPENRVVVCTMNVDMQLIKFDSYDMVEPKMWKTKAPMVNMYGRFIVTAKARCNSNDNFDEVTGKRIAESRAKSKAFRIAKNVWKCIAEKLLNEYNISMKMYKNCSAMEVFETKHKEKLLG